MENRQVFFCFGWFSRKREEIIKIWAMSGFYAAAWGSLHSSIGPRCGVAKRRIWPASG